MKKSFFLLSAILLMGFTARDFRPEAPHTAQDGKASAQADDKAALIDYFRETEESLLASIKGLSAEQLRFKPAPDRWSVSECLEHIILVDKALFGMARQVIEQPANPERKKEIKVSDQELIAGMKDRSQKASAPEFGLPKGTYANAEEAVAAFREEREKITDYIRDTRENLREHVTDSPGGPVDAHQFLLFIAAHSARHTLQIEEVKAHPEFP